MTLVEFIKSQLSKDTQIGDLARDIYGDKDFPSGKNEEEIISYLNFKTNFGGTSAVFKRLLKAFNKQKGISDQSLDLDAKFAVLKSENWQFYKEYFPVDKVILVGMPTDFYKVYCIDSSNRKALFFDIKSSGSLNDIPIVDETNIHIGNLTKKVSVAEAVDLLENCTYEQASQPNKERFDELLSFLKANN